MYIKKTSLQIALFSIFLNSSGIQGSGNIENQLIDNNKEISMIKPNSSFPVFIVNSLDLAKTFYENYFGFNVAFQNEWYLHLVSNSGIQVAFMLPDQPTQPDIYKERYNGNGLIFSLEVDDADKAYEFANNKSLDIALELRSEEWGQRHFSIKDPNGVYVDIVQATEPTEEYKAGYDIE